MLAIALRSGGPDIRAQKSVAGCPRDADNVPMAVNSLPLTTEMYRALSERDASYEGIFVAAVRSTGIFCRPTCPARKPRPENVTYFPTARDALFAGFRPCLRCRPLERAGQAPAWIRPVLQALEQDPARRWRDRDLRDLGLEPGRVRRWFQREHGMTFQGYGRARRLGAALGRIRLGDDIDGVAFDHGYESLSGFREAFGQLVGVPPGRARSSRPIALTRLLTPLGPMVAAAVDDGVCLLEFAERRMLAVQLGRVVRLVGGVVTPGSHPHLERLDRELGAYFAGRRTTFSVPLHAPGTPFQEACWAYLRSIPSGETRTYAQGAAAVGRPDAIRAFGRANGDNRLAILIPCHRVVGGDGRLTGYGGGLWRKQALLDLEAGTG